MALGVLEADDDVEPLQGADRLERPADDPVLPPLATASGKVPR